MIPRQVVFSPDLRLAFALCSTLILCGLGVGDYKHPVPTSSPRAQLFFNQGLTLTFGFNHREAGRSFREVALSAGAADLEGVVSIQVKHADRAEYRVGLVVGETPEPLHNWVVAMLPSEALYSPELEYARSVKSVGGYRGQILNVPTIELGTDGTRLRAISLVALDRAPRVAVAACIGGLGPGHPVRIATTERTGSGELQSISGRIVELSDSRNIVQLDTGARAPRLGDPVFAGATAAPLWRVLGLVRSMGAANQVEIATLPQIFRNLPSEAGGWGLHPLGLCDPRERAPEPGYSNELWEYMKPAILAMGRPDRGDPAPAMRQAWRAIRSYLSRPDIEHYLYNPRLSDEQQFAQFWGSLPAWADFQASLLSPVAAPGPVVRMTTKLPLAAPERGWAVAVRYTEGRVYAEGTVSFEGEILLLTAHHLVKPGPGGERDIMVYFPALQGFGLQARRLPFVDESLDLAVIAVQAPDELRDNVFRFYMLACPDDLTGPVEVPVNAWGWRRQRQRGHATNGPNPGSLRVTGVDVVYFGLADLRNGRT